ncbi:hypothetical protein [Thermofilum sp.]|uniref:hypothetical protein n=1 Tax=Thermofilum sp. TaxID=1961369 RepID=UPI00258EC66E|nr:hypothetical protein [Thermofilum sp.]
MPMLQPKDIIEKQLHGFREALDREAQLMPEAIQGLLALYTGEEDITCFALKRIYGKRDKGEAKRVF